MLNPRWKKVFRDIWSNKTRALLVILSIAVGGFALGTVLHLQVLVGGDLVQSYRDVSPAQIVIYTEEGFDQDFIAAMRRAPGVAAVQGRRSMIMKFRRTDNDTWYAIQLFALEDYENIEVNKVKPERIFDPDPGLWPQPNVWPPPKHALLLERTSLLMDSLGLGAHVKQGDSIFLETPTGKVREVPLVGLCYDLSRAPATFSGMAAGYVSFDTLEWLGLPQNFNELHIVADGSYASWAQLKVLGRQLQDRVERSGYTVTKLDVPEPGKLPMDGLFRAITLILGSMGAFSLFLAVFLVINTISALLTQQVRQIGVMKAVGAREDQLIGMYLTMIVVFGVVSVLISAPSAAYIAEAAVHLLSYFINYQMSAFRVAPEVIVVQLLVGVLVPVLAGIYPVLAGARITVREAIASQGLGGGSFGGSRFDRWIESIRGLPRPILLSVRNTFRRKWRLILTLATLILAGAVFIGVTSVRSSMDATMNDLFKYWQFDVQIQFARSYRLERVAGLIRLVPGVVEMEGWASTSSYRLRPDGSEGESFSITAPPLNSKFIQPQLVAGRWLQSGDTNQMVINLNLWKQEPDIKMGDSIVIRLDGRDTTWQVVGAVKMVGDNLAAFTTYDSLVQAVRDVGSASSVQILISPNDAVNQVRMAKLIEAQLTAAGLDVTSKYTNVELRQQSATLFDIIATLLMVMSVLMAVVGGLGLAGTMSLNVLERTREIGVMRAVGASDQALLQVFMIEGMFIGVLSWIGGFVLSIPVGAILSYEVGVQFLNTPLSYQFSLAGAVVWLVLVLILSAISTFLPAQRAAALSVREVLAYE